MVPSAEAQALVVVDKNWDGELNFEELCCFLAVYRGSEGFTKEEARGVALLRRWKMVRNLVGETWKDAGNWEKMLGNMVEQMLERMLVRMVGEWLAS